MKSIIIISVALMAFPLFSCGRKESEKVFQVFNEGVTLSLRSIVEYDKGNYENAVYLNRQSIAKFRETLKLDSSHSGVRSALGHALYIDKQFKDAIHWFDQANKMNGEAAINLREMGLCKINVGQLQEGKSDIDKALSLDTTKEIRELTIQDLTDIGELAYHYGDGVIQQGDPDKGKEYKKFSIRVLMIAYNYDNSNKEIALKVSDYAERAGDIETATRYKALSGQ